MVFAGFAYMGACAPGPDLDVLRLTFSREIFSFCQRFSASQPHRNGRQSEDSAILSRTNPFPLEKFTHSPQGPGLNCLDLENGGRYRIRTYDFHRVKMALYR
jgi:hypothetical protein